MEVRKEDNPKEEIKQKRKVLAFGNYTNEMFYFSFSFSSSSSFFCKSNISNTGFDYEAAKKKGKKNILFQKI
jgi:hypothetical protein